MDNLYDIRSWSRLYREDALREARERHLTELARTRRRTRTGPDHAILSFVRRSLLPLLRRARLAG